jgi:tetratricopeptide (TPR) repeat protein
MDFYAVLDQVLDLLRQRGRVAYRVLKLHFKLDDETLEALKDELIYSQRLAVDAEGKVLVWAGDADAASALATAPAQDRTPLAYTPPHLTDKILAARPALEGERKQVTVLFADLKDSTELIRGLDPEAAQQLLDPALHLMMDAVHRFEGTVNQVLGDGIMALFGAPIAHEDHALRACYAALAMQAAEFLYETRLFPEPEYTFKHALTHEVAYASLLLERRRVLHARIVEALEALAPDRVAEQVARLAHHALRGEVWDKAVPYCQQALALANELGMRPLVAHCHLSLGQLYGQTGRAEQARAALTTAINLYRAMDMIFWLPQAEAALAQMQDG